MTIVATEDNRNLEWRKNNVGSTLLQKMGWKEGEGIGKRGNNSNTTALRALKRKQGLGLGAKIESEGGNSESSSHFSAVLANLKGHHATTDESSSSKKSRKKSKKSKKLLTLPSNKVTAGHSRKMRQAKFGAKSAQDMACIFGNSEASFVTLGVTSAQDIDTEKRIKKKKKRNAESVEASNSSSDSSFEEKREKKRQKKEKKRKKEKSS